MRISHACMADRQRVDRVMPWQTFARLIVTAAITGLVFRRSGRPAWSWGLLLSVTMGISAIGGSVPVMRVRLRSLPWR